ncbi:hypothetical protein LN042_29235 [Kitasatospora sp. RB6PN24]|uniref:hypothetical protein n=1 Tax=Kitasatospora humi TaxID=2893891 RepID=UPI001E3B746A|nr:hypothetical protein [Kitasatospora humi]MCC9311101.1 hypothetical protein [Kitasatospora humi]
MRKSLKAVIAGGAAMLAVSMGSGTAFADTATNAPKYADVTVNTNYGDCEANISLVGTDQDYVQSNFWNHNTGDTFNCHFWIQRAQRDSSGNYGKFTSLYGNQPIYLGPTPGGVNLWSTGQYWDGPGYLAEACFYMTDLTGWTGATHCTNPI